MKRVAALFVLFSIVAVAVVGLDPTGVLLGKMRGEPFFQDRPTRWWRQALVDPSPGAQTNTRSALASGREEALPVLIDLLSRTQGSAEVRWNAAMALGDIGPAADPAVPHLAGLLDEPDPLVRLTAADALGKIGRPSAVAVPRIAALLEKDEPVRLLKALRRLRGVNQAAYPEVLKVLDHADAEARENACEALGEMGAAAADAVPQLTARLKDDNEKVRSEAQRALEAIAKAVKGGAP